MEDTLELKERNFQTFSNYLNRFMTEVINDPDNKGTDLLQYIGLLNNMVYRLNRASEKIVQDGAIFKD